MAREKAEEKTTCKGKEVNRVISADPSTLRMQAKIDIAPKTTYYPRPTLAIFIPLATRSPRAMRRKNSSPCPNITEEDDYYEIEDDGVGLSHSHDLCIYELTFET